jgi:Fe2+ transport system protein FeoA
MKERKTNRHTDTMEHGHIDTITSEQEFKVARKLSELGTVKQGDIQVKWETPLGYVEFPDGYQFCLFKSEPNLEAEVDSSYLTQSISQEITKSMDRYQTEYDDVSQKAKEIYKNRKDLCDDFGLVEESDELMVKEFADLKARYLQSEALDLLERIALDNGYYNKDVTGHTINVRPGQHPLVEIIGFDFEYYVSTPDLVNRVRTARAQWLKDSDSTRHSTQSLGGDRPIMIAASYAMLQNEGFTLPPSDD